MSDEVELRTAQAGDLQHDHIIAMVEFIREATMPLMGAADDEWVDRSSLLMVALCMYAGSIFGTMITADIARDQDKKRVTDSMAKNFRSGIDVGKARATRVMFNNVEGHA